MLNFITDNKYYILAIFVLVVGSLWLAGNPQVVFAQDGLVTCTNDCNWQSFIQLINNLITWLIGIATVIATLLFMYAGFLYLTARGNQSQAEQATGIFTNVAIGFGIILVAWLIVSTIVTLLTSQQWRDNNSNLLPIDLSQHIEERKFITKSEIITDIHV